MLGCMNEFFRTLSPASVFIEKTTERSPLFLVIDVFSTQNLSPMSIPVIPRRPSLTDEPLSLRTLLLALRSL